MEASLLATGYWLLVGYCTSSPMHAKCLRGSPTKYCAIGPEIQMKSDLISSSLKGMRTHEALFIFVL